MRILMIETGGWGGICHYAYNLCTALAERVDSLELLTAEPYELSNLPQAFEIRTPFSSGTPYCGKIRQSAMHYRRFRPHVVHLQSTFSARKDWLLMDLAGALHIPVVFTAHNILPHEISEREAFGMRWAYARIYRAAARVIVHSEDSRKTLQSAFGTPDRKIATIPHGNYVFADSSPCVSQTRARRQLDLPVDGRMLLAFGTIRPYKGTEDLLNAFERIAGEVPDVYLVIAGKPIGLDPDIYARAIAVSAFRDRIAFRPDYVALEDIAGYFTAADIAVFPYHAIYQSGALQLAYAFSKPVVATRVGAFPETVDEGRNGLLVPPGDPAAMSAALLDLLQRNTEDLNAMGRHARHLADTRYAWTTVAEKTQQIYLDLTVR